jgi:hypothetical protein
MGNNHGHGGRLQSMASDPLDDITNTIKVPKQNVNTKRILLMGRYNSLPSLTIVVVTELNPLFSNKQELYSTKAFQ